MTKADVINEISEKTGIDKLDVQASVEAFFSVVKTSMAEGANIYVRGFGSFVNKKYYQTIPRNQPYIIVTKHRIICTELFIQKEQILLKNKLEITSVKLDEIEEMWTLIGRYESTITPTNSLADRVAILEERIETLEKNN